MLVDVSCGALLEYGHEVIRILNNSAANEKNGKMLVPLSDPELGVVPSIG